MTETWQRTASGHYPDAVHTRVYGKRVTAAAACCAPTVMCDIVLYLL
jgi:hypothetical protein